MSDTIKVSVISGDSLVDGLPCRISRHLFQASVSVISGDSLVDGRKRPTCATVA